MPTPLLRALLVALVAALLIAPTAAAAPADPGPSATTAAKKACKRKKGESKKRWLKRCKCTKYKRGETRKKFKKRCPGAKVPKRKAPSGGGQAPAAPRPAPARPAPGQSDVDKVTAALLGTQLQYFTYSNTLGRVRQRALQVLQRHVLVRPQPHRASRASPTTRPRAGTWRITQAQRQPGRGVGHRHAALRPHEPASGATSIRAAPVGRRADELQRQQGRLRRPRVRRHEGRVLSR